MPLSPNGKLDRRSLASRELPADEVDREVIAPRNATEGILIRLASELLGGGVPWMGIHDNFLRGWHSTRSP